MATFSLISEQLRQTSGNGRDEEHVGELGGSFWTLLHQSTLKKGKTVRPNARLVSYLSEMSGPVYGRPAVEGVLHGEVSRVWGALKEGAQGTDISIPASPMEREAAV